MAEQDLKKMITDKFIIYKRKLEVSLKPIEEKFREKIDNYFKNINQVSLK